MTLVDTNVLLDIATDDPKWARWSLRQIGYTRIEDVDRVLAGAGLELIGIPRAALFLAGKVFQRYRARGGSWTGVLPDFFIGAHAAVAQLPLLTRDPSHYRRYFSGIALITPDTEPI
jgi:predicted nucleic acid-binding protein